MQKTAYEVRISDLRSDVCSSYLVPFWSQFGSFPAAPQNSRFANWDTGTSFRRDDRFYQASLHGQYEISDSINLTSITAYSDLEAERPVDNDGKIGRASCRERVCQYV